MCGIAGFLTSSAHSDNKASLERMASKIEHRGPDADGFWCDESSGIYLAHKRLAIVDLSEAGAQPMPSRSQRFILSYNGEIYNHIKIRDEIQQNTDSTIQWRGHSDTETLLAAVEHWGFEMALSKLNGMFAIALWDRDQKALYLARDRMGEKPLYFSRIGKSILFGSELKALKAHSAWKADIDEKSVADFLRFNNVPAPNTIYKNVYKLKPAHWIRVDTSSMQINVQHSYWDLDEIAGKSLSSENDIPLQDSIEIIENSLSKAVQSRMMADVPLGAFLSGGIDSSLVTALMCQHSSRSIKTFSIGFKADKYNEAVHAKKVAQHLATDHTELYVDQRDALDVIPNLHTIWDEPFADSSQIPTYLVAKLCREHVTVGLSGDGGDELFYGYSRYEETKSIWQKINRYPKPIRSIIGQIMGSLGPSNFKAASLIQSVLDKNESMSSLKNRLVALASLVSSNSIDELFIQMNTMNRQSPLTNKSLSSRVVCPSSLSSLSTENKMMLHDQNNYLPDTILTKVDRASMAVSLESRAPLLDHELVESAWNLPLDTKFRDQKGKWILRNTLGKYVPNELFDRPKMGFGVPMEHWLRGELKDWAEDLLDKHSLKQEGYFDVNHVRHLWKLHSSSNANLQYQLWPILMFQQWLRNE